VIRWKQEAKYGWKLQNNTTAGFNTAFDNNGGDEMVGLFETVAANGEKELSSRRVIGAIVAGAGLLMILALGLVSFFVQAADAGTIQTVGLTTLGIGSSLLGLGIFDHLVKK
jgi:hypothetical protein